MKQGGNILLQTPVPQAALKYERTTGIELSDKCVYTAELSKANLRNKFYMCIQKQ